MRLLGVLVNSESKVSVIIPAYNEANHIVSYVRRVEQALKTLRRDYEIVVVDDGSSDGTFRLAAEAFNGNGRIKIIGYDRNRGKGYAVKYGFASTSGNTVFFVDADSEIDPNFFHTYSKLLHNADIVVASKRHPASQVKYPLLRKILSKSFNVLTQLLTGLRIRDTQCGAKAFRRHVLETLFPKLLLKQYAFDVELLTAANMNGYRIVEGPVKVEVNSGYLELRHIFKMFIDLLAVTYRKRLLKWYGLRK